MSTQRFCKLALPNLRERRLAVETASFGEDDFFANHSHDPATMRLTSRRALTRIRALETPYNEASHVEARTTDIAKPPARKRGPGAFRGFGRH
jgi:hypothetical protein